MKVVQQVWHGDSIELCKKFKDGRVNCVITDPPFGVDNQSNMAVTDHGKKYARKIANDESPEQAIRTFKAVMNTLLPKTAPDADCYVFTAHQVVKEWLVMCDEFMAKHGFERKAIIIWKKEGPGMGDLDIAWGMGCEFVLFFQKGHRMRGIQRRNSIIEVPQLRPNELIHPHEKPLPLLELFIKASTGAGETVVDPFGGSGSIARACRNTGRTGISIELDDQNYELASNALAGAENALL